MWTNLITASSYDFQFRRKFRVYFVIFSLFLTFVGFSDGVSVYIYNDSLTDFDVISIDNGPLTSPYYNSSCISLLHTHGFNGTQYGRSSNTSLTAMLYYKKNICCANVFFLDWSDKVSVADGTSELSTKAQYVSKGIPNCKSVGEALGKLLLYWAANYGFSLDCLHMLGHSLGAHTLGYCGRYTKARGSEVNTIIGLDAAGALFGGFTLLQRLDKNCAKNVAGIHTDGGSTGSKHYGINETYGDWDYWFNYLFTEDSVQPNCGTGEYKFLSPEALCSHDRSVVYYSLTWYYQTCCLSCKNGTKSNETVSNPNQGQVETFDASKADNYLAWKAGEGSTNYVTIGACINPAETGNYFLRTSGTTPYALGPAGATPN